MTRHLLSGSVLALVQSTQPALGGDDRITHRLQHLVPELVLCSISCLALAKHAQGALFAGDVARDGVVGGQNNPPACETRVQHGLLQFRHAKRTGHH